MPYNCLYKQYRFGGAGAHGNQLKPVLSTRCRSHENESKHNEFEQDTMETSSDTVLHIWSRSPRKWVWLQYADVQTLKHGLDGGSRTSGKKLKYLTQHRAGGTESYENVINNTRIVKMEYYANKHSIDFEAWTHGNKMWSCWTRNLWIVNTQHRAVGASQWNQTDLINPCYFGWAIKKNI